MPRIKPISQLSPWSTSKRLPLRAPKAATSKAPDYIVLHEQQKKTVSRGGKITNITEPTKTIYPEPSVMNERNVCTMGKGKQQLRACHVELLFVGDKHAPQIGKPPGAYLRFCQRTGQKDAPLVRVKDHSEAQRISTAYCACKKSGKSAEACARTVGGGNGNRGHVVDKRRR